MAGRTAVDLPTATKVGDSLFENSRNSLQNDHITHQDRACSDANERGSKERLQTSETTPMSKPTTETPVPTRRPQRKLSVFSHNGFQQINQLDQAILRQHDAQEQQQSQQPQQSAASQGSSMVADMKETPQTSEKSSQRPARTDTLGSTGSSRASSCDEPTIAQQNLGLSNGMKPPSISNRSETGLSSTSNSSNKQSSNSSSNSSINSISDPANERKKSTVAKETVIPPFESIRTQLKRNSIPNAEFMRQHIDRLISQNEAIIDNCNLVSIRSYNNNSSSISSNHSSSTSLTQRRQTTTAEPSVINGDEQRRQDSGSFQESSSSPRRTKRWSTTAINSGSNTVFASSPLSLTQAHLSPSKLLQSQHGLRFPALERKRSCNIVMSTLEPIPQQQEQQFNNGEEEYQQQNQCEEREFEKFLSKTRPLGAGNILRQQIIQQQQLSRQSPLDLALLHMTQQENDAILTAWYERQRQHQLDNQLLNEYLARMMLSNQGGNVEPLLSTNVGSIPIPQQQQQQQQQQEQPQPTESPAYRCEACDISFWTPDLLNYHSMTQCSARRGPQLSRPLAFNFVGPNNFDSVAYRRQISLVSDMADSEPLAGNNNFLTVPPSIAKIPTNRESHHHISHQSLSKSASPPHSRGDQDEHEERMVNDILSQPTSGGMEHLLFNGSLAENLRLSILKDQLLGSGVSGIRTLDTSDEPHNLSTRTQRERLLPPLPTTIQHNQQIQRQAQNSSLGGSSLLPFKKRKISEPNMRY